MIAVDGRGRRVVASASLSAERPTDAPPSPRCPACGTERTSRSRRSGYRETVLLRIAGRAPWRCHACGRRFTAPSASEIEGRRRHRTLAGYLGVQDPKRRYRLQQRVRGAVMAVAALLIALALLRFCAAILRAPASEGGASSALPAREAQPSG